MRLLQLEMLLQARMLRQAKKNAGEAAARRARATPPAARLLVHHRQLKISRIATGATCLRRLTKFIRPPYKQSWISRIRTGRALRTPCPGLTKLWRKDRRPTQILCPRNV